MRQTILLTLFSFLLFHFGTQAQNSTSISYLGTPFCNAGFATVTINGDSYGGKYSATPIGLVIDSVTGLIDLEKSIPKTYIVEYDLNCPKSQCIYTTIVTIHGTASTIKYVSDTFCKAVLPIIQSVILTETGSITGGIYTATPLGLSIDSNTGDITPSLSANGNYLVVYAYKDSICGVISDTTTISIVDKVTPKITIIASVRTICLGTSVTVTAMPVNVGMTPTYQWYKNELPIKDTTNVTLTYIPLMNDTITCRIVADNLCSDIKTVTSNSIIIIVNKPTSAISNVYTCCGSFFWHGTTYTTSGKYTFDTLNLNGCDSLTTLNLSLTQPPTRDTMVTTCSSFSWHGTNYTSSGIVTLNVKNTDGCDSIITLHLTINQPTTRDLTVNACGSFNWHGTIYTSTGISTYTLINSAGCDSVEILHLTINQPTTGDTSVIACTNFEWYGTTYTNTGTGIHTFTNATGCDSIVTIHLTINQPTTSDTTVIACGSFSWYGTTYTSTVTAYHTFMNAMGCDSMVNLHLTINQPSIEYTEEVRCNSFNWHGTIYTSTGTYTFDSLNAKGCDSLAILHLTINLVPVVTNIIGVKTVYEGQKIDLSNNTPSGVWISQNPLIATIDNTGKVTGVSKGYNTIYYVVSNNCGADTANFDMDVLPNTLYIPNVFSPNGRGINDIFLVRGAGNLVNQMELRIFDSWGNELFLSKGGINDRSKGWDGTLKGKPEPPGVYVYVVRLEMKTGEIQVKKGAINLIR